MSAEMRDLTGKGAVDLYYNDVWSLQTSLRNIAEKGWISQGFGERQHDSNGRLEDETLKLLYKIYGGEAISW